MDLYNILVVDDEMSNVNALQRVLKPEYNVFSAINGEDALAIMEQNDIALVIADHRMPGMTGAELLEKTLQKYPNTMRIILTAYMDEKLLLDAINRVQAHAFLTKPWESEQVEFTVKKWIEMHEIIEKLAEKAGQSENLQRQLEEANKAAEEAKQQVAQLTRQLEQTQQQLEYHQSSRWRRRSRKDKATGG